MSRRQIVERVEELASKVSESLDVQLVDVELVNEGGIRILRIYIEKAGGVGLDDCEAVSRRLDKHLDEEDMLDFSYMLEVSSPGLERRLKHDREYQVFIGRYVEVNTYAPVEGRKRFQGILMGLNDGVVSVDESGTTIQIPKDRISKAQLVYRAEQQ
jgi:ribosome maturation factor RimP